MSAAHCLYTDSMRSSLNESIMGDMDPSTMERCALTESVSYFINLFEFFKYLNNHILAHSNSGI